MEKISLKGQPELTEEDVFAANRRREAVWEKMKAHPAPSLFTPWVKFLIVVGFLAAIGFAFLGYHWANEPAVNPKLATDYYLAAVEWYMPPSGNFPMAMKLLKQANRLDPSNSKIITALLILGLKMNDEVVVQNAMRQAKKNGWKWLTSEPNPIYPIQADLSTAPQPQAPAVAVPGGQ